MATRHHGRPSQEMTARNQTIDIGDRREIVAFSSYPEAEAAVDALADERFPVERLAIVAQGLRYVENVTGGWRYRHAIVGGLVSGALIGALLGFFFGLFDWVTPLVTGLVLAFYGAIIGGLGGALFGGLGHWLTEGRRNFSSVAGMRAERYVVMCDAEMAGEALRRLAAGARRS